MHENASSRGVDAGHAPGGCATLTPEQYRLADWRQIGFSDGAGGASAARINDHAKAWAEAGVKPDLDNYLRGREQGLVSYCRAENGFTVGRGGGYANGADCPESMKYAFMDQYRRGRAMCRIDVRRMTWVRSTPLSREQFST